MVVVVNGVDNLIVDQPEQTFFSNGVAEDVITDLSRFSSLFVIGHRRSRIAAASTCAAQAASLAFGTW